MMADDALLLPEGRGVLRTLRHLNEELLAQVEPEMWRDLHTLATSPALRKRRRAVSGALPAPKRRCLDTRPSLWHDSEVAPFERI